MTKSSDNTKQRQTVIFLHIPKAAGSTLHKIIERQYKPNAIFSIDGQCVRESIDEFKNLPETQREKIRALKGHMYFGLHEFLPRPSTYITILRDPVERIISHYYYVLREPNHYLYNDVISQNMSLKDYVCSGISTELDNGQTRLISGIEQTGIGWGECSQNILEMAKNNIQENFAVVGIVEKFDETLMLIKNIFRYKIPFYIKKNVTSARPLKQEISQDTLKYIKHYNELDIELYQFAKNRFNEIITHQPYLERELKIFKCFNQLYGKVYSLSQGSS